MATAKDRSTRAALAAKTDSEHHQRIRRSDDTERWDDVEDAEASTYLLADARGPDPVPAWVLTDDAARQHDLGLLKTGKEADVHLVERRLGDQVNLLAAKRYRSFEDRMFRDDARYRAGRKTGASHTDKAMEKGGRIGMALRARQWVETEFDVLCRLWSAGAPVPYPVQRLGREVLLEHLGDDDGSAPRLVHAHLSRAEVRDAWDQLVEVLRLLARNGVVHGDLSPYNLLWHRGRLMVIDLPQAVDPIAHPEGLALLRRDVEVVCAWAAHGGLTADPDALFAEVLAEAFG